MDAARVLCIPGHPLLHRRLEPYLPQEDVYNHKDSSAIMGEMAAANGVDVEVLSSLRPGSENVRQKLCLAATRIATKQEDLAYSLFGIFDVSIPVTYGEGQQRALGRLLQEVLTQSGDVTILAWTGKASDYNSCLPAEIGVYREPVSPHVPPPIEDGKMIALVAELRAPSANLDSAVKLYDSVVILPSPRLFSRRLSLSCIMFPLRGQLVLTSSSPRVYRTVTSALATFEIKTMEDLSGLTNMVLVHPWLKCLLDPFEDLIVDDDTVPFTPLDGDDRDNNYDVLLADALSLSQFNEKHRLGAVNSINWARILVQIVHYFSAYFQLLNNPNVDVDRSEIQFVVPTGNFGEILAGYYAKRMGLPMGKLGVAINSSDILEEWIIPEI
ncbi:hypothetical protein J3R83DRAFT_14040 [Lanmaoa asiatica]|nr:hypothetical protein J3R83DRAFT_14040 [Lanmaoa asiatica]